MASSSIAEDMRQGIIAALIAASVGQGGNPAGVPAAVLNKWLTAAAQQAYAAG